MKLVSRTHLRLSGLWLGLALLFCSTGLWAQASSPTNKAKLVVAASKSAGPANTPKVIGAKRSMPASALNPQAREFASALQATQPAQSPAMDQPAVVLGQLLSKVAALRSRLSALTKALFASRVRVEVQSQGEDFKLKSLSITLDGGVVYVAPKQSFFSEAQVVYEHAVSPGAHVLGVVVERQAGADARYLTWQSSRFVVVVPDKQQLNTRLQLEAEGDLAEQFGEEGEGGSELIVRLQVEVNE